MAPPTKGPCNFKKASVFTEMKKVKGRRQTFFEKDCRDKLAVGGGGGGNYPPWSPPFIFSTTSMLCLFSEEFFNLLFQGQMRETN